MSMNAPFVPDDLQSGYADAFALLKILADPAAHKQRLDELVAQENATNEQIAALNEMAGDTRRLHTAAQAATIVLNNRKTALDTREAEIDTRAQALELTEATRSHKALQRREAAVQAREGEAVREEKRLAAVKTDLEGKHASIKGLADTLHH
jgi:ribosomal protein L16 Arg81 hydroxylase